MKSWSLRLVLWLAGMIALGCGLDSKSRSVADADSDTHSDSDVDTEVDTNSDTDTTNDPTQEIANPCSDDHPWECSPTDITTCDFANNFACDLGVILTGKIPPTIFSFNCFPNSTAQEGEHCQWDFDGPWCAPGLTCDDTSAPAGEDAESGVCRKWCCSDSECSEDQTCDTIVSALINKLSGVKWIIGDELGICLGPDVDAGPDGGLDSGP